MVKVALESCSTNLPCNAMLSIIVSEGNQAILHFCDFGEIYECGFLCSHPDNLWRSHDKLFLLSRDHLGVLIPHDGEDTLQEFVVSVVTIVACPRIGLG